MNNCSNIYETYSRNSTVFDKLTILSDEHELWLPNLAWKSDKWLNKSLCAMIIHYFDVGCWGWYPAISN